MDCPPESRLVPNSFWQDDQQLFGVRKVNGQWIIQLSNPVLRQKLIDQNLWASQMRTEKLRELQDLINGLLAQIGHPPLKGWKRLNKLYWTQDRKFSLNGDEGWRINGSQASSELRNQSFKSRGEAHQHLIKWRAEHQL